MPQIDERETEILDVTGRVCPLPVLKLRKRLSSLTAGATVTMLATDPAARIDVPHFCAEAGHELVDEAKDGETLRFTVRKG